MSILRDAFSLRSHAPQYDTAGRLEVHGPVGRLSATLSSMWLVYAMIGNALWSASDVINSILVHRYHKNPIVLAWIQGIFDCILLVGITLFFDVRSSWIPLFIVAGVAAYGAFLMFFHVLHRVDVSVMNSSSVFQTIFVSIGGFWLFGESWNQAQILGVVLALGGVLFLSYWHKHVSLVRTIALLGGLGFLYSPIFLIQKAALLDGESVLVVFFWPVFIAETSAFLFPLCIQKHRSSIFALGSSMKAGFIALSIFAMLSSTAGFAFFTMAYNFGQVSLVSVSEGVQPFFTIFFAWIVLKMASSYVPKELLTTQSIQVKLVSFCIVFAGLGLLVVG